MSRRKRRERPATPAEQRQVREFAALAEAAISGPVEQRAATVRRMTRVADRLRDPDNLSAVPTRDLLNAIRERYPTSELDTAKKHQKADYGAPQSGQKPPDFRPMVTGDAALSTSEGAT